MGQAPLPAGDEPIGVMLDHEALNGIALVTVDPWRRALRELVAITCLGEPALITWPIWLASESQGRRSPAAALI